MNRKSKKGCTTRENARPGSISSAFFSGCSIREESKTEAKQKVGLETFGQLWHIISNNKYVDSLNLSR